jgi:geranylgeranyl pyrophosphate synthase
MLPLANTPAALPGRAAVIAEALAFGARTIREPRHLAMFEATIALERGEGEALSLGRDLAPAAYAAASGSAAWRTDLATLSHVLWTAFDVLDDLGDGDAAAKWPAFGQGELMVMAGSLIAATAHEMAAALHDDPAVRAQLHACIARGIRRMGDGQIADLADTGRNDLTAASVEATVAGKTGAECALFAGLGATLAGASPDHLVAYETFGVEYGIANQYATDLAELFGDDVCRDIVNGTRTLPIVLHLARLAGSERDAFVRALDDARRDPAAAAGVRTTLASSPALRATVLQILIHAERARVALASAQPHAAGAALLEQFLRELEPGASA